MEDSAADASDASSPPGSHHDNCGADCGHEHQHRKMDDDDEEHSKYVASWQERPDDPENTWSAFPAPPSALYNPQYHPARLLWDRSGRGRPRRRPPLPYSLGFTPKDMRRLRFVTDPTVLGQTSRILGHLPPSPGPNVIHHRGCINAACWSPNGRQLFTGSDDRLVKVWECKTAEKGWEELFCVSTGHTNNIFQVKLQPGAEHNVFTCAADGTVRSFDLGGMLDLPPGYIVRNMNHAEDVNGRVVGRHEMSMVHGFEFWQGGHQGGGNGASTLFVALEEGALMRYDLREPEWRGEAVITRRGRAVKAVAIPDPDNFSRGVSPWMLCVGGAEAGLDIHDIRRFGPGSGCSRLRCLCPRGLPPCPVPSPLDSERWNSREEVSVSGLAFSRRRAELLVSYQGDQIYGFRLDEPGGEEEEEGRGGSAGGAGDPVAREAWSVGGHLNSQTFLKTVAYFGPQEEYIVSGCDTGHTWVWDRRTGGLAAWVTTDTSISNGVIPHPWAPMLACYGIDSELKLLEVGGPYFSGYRKREDAAAAYVADEAAEAETALQRGRPEWTREPARQRRLLNNYLEHKLLPQVFPGAPKSQARPRFVKDAWRFQCHIARVRSAGAKPVQWPVEGEGGGGISAGGRRLASLLPEYASDMEDWVGRPRRLAWLYVAAEEAPAPVESEPTDYALGLQRFRDLVDALLYLKDRGNAHFKAKAYGRAEQLYDQVASYIPRVKMWMGVNQGDVERVVKQEQEQRRAQRQQQQGGTTTAATAAAVAEAAPAEQQERGGEPAAAGGVEVRDEQAAAAFVTGLGKELWDLTQVVLLNMAASKLATSRPDEALKHLDMVLGHYDADHPKALYRKGLALLALKRPEEAVEALAKAVEVEPGDALVQRKLAEAKRAWAVEKKRQARVYSAFFASSGAGGGGEE